MGSRFICVALYIYRRQQSEPGQSANHRLRGNCQKGTSGGCVALLWRNGKQTTAARDEWISLWNSKHNPITGRTHLEATGVYSFKNLERGSNARRAYGSVSVPSEPGPHGSVIIRRLPDKLGTGCSSRGTLFFRRRYLIEWGGTRHYLKSPGAHGGNYVQTVLFGYTPTAQMKSQKSSWQLLLSPRFAPALSPLDRPPVCSALVLIIISFSAAVPSQWLEALKVLFQVFKTEEDEAQKEINNGALVVRCISARLWLSNIFVYRSRINYHTWSI